MSGNPVGLQLVQKYSSLQTELHALVDYINETRNTLGGLHSELPAASDALASVTEATEKATHAILELVEGVMEQDESMSDAMDKLKAAAEAHEDAELKEAVDVVMEGQQERSNKLIQIMTELSFQDLTCQTIDRISSTVLEIERRVIGLMDEPESEPDAEGSLQEAAALAGVSRLRESQQGESRQGAIDDILKNMM